MKVFLLCADGLEHNFVQGYPHLKQKQFYRIPIPKKCMTIFEDGTIGPFSPIIWEVIFTGKYGQDRPTKKPSKFKRRIRRILRKIELKPHTIVFHAEKSIIIHNPLLTSVEWQQLPLDVDASFDDIANSATLLFQNEKADTLKRLHSPWDLFIVYTKLLDVTGHLYWQQNRKIAQYYQMVNDFAGNIQEQLTNDAVMVIVSDHGMMPLKGTNRFGGQHSEHAFASFNRSISLKNLELTQIHSLITRFMKRN